MMSKDLKEYLNDLKVVTYIMSNDRHFIGKQINEDRDEILIQSLCSIESFFDDENGSYSQMLIPLMPNNFEEVSKINKNHVSVTTNASFALKKAYCETLLKLKIEFAIPSVNQLNNNINQQKPTDNFKNRWN
jgi:hypothetical protein